MSDRAEVVTTRGTWIILRVRRVAASDMTMRSHLFRTDAIDVIEPHFRPPGDNGYRSIVHVGPHAFECDSSVEEIGKSI